MSEKVYVWGDSIAKGIVFDAQRGRYVGLRERSGFAQAAQELHVEMENHAHFGMTSEKGKMIVQNGLKDVEAGRPALLGFGGNDVDFDWPAIAKTPDERHDPHVTPEQFAQNMAQMVRAVREKGLVPVLLTLPPIDSKRYFEWVTRGIADKENVLCWLGDVERIYRTHKEYSDLVSQVAATLSVHLIDVRGAFERAGDLLKKLCVDGIHPNQEGHGVISEALKSYALSHAF
jgi:lysophospholipase L1-like esterase